MDKLVTLVVSLALVVFFALVMLVPLLVLNAWALWVLWGWFVVPFGIPAISFTHSMGVALIVGYMTHQYNDNNKDPDKSKTEQRRDSILYALVRPPVVVAVGWVIHYFM